MRNNILIIDDDMDLCTLLSRFLSKNGYETDIAHTGSKGIAKFSEKKYDVVICDYRLGDMEGKEVVSALKKLNQQVIILVITGYNNRNQRVKWLSSVHRHLRAARVSQQTVKYMRTVSSLSGIPLPPRHCMHRWIL